VPGGTAETATAEGGTAVLEPGTLYVVATPIGNLGDLTLRALDVLRGVQIILAEDTRQTHILLDRYGIRTPMAPLHEHNESRSIAGVLARLGAGESAALVSDAGTPLISDPGQRLVRAIWDAGFRAVPVPGPSAVLAALAAAGVDTSRFTFFGFLPRSGRARQEALRDASVMPHTSVIYESPERLVRTLGDLAELGAGEREVVVARELTKRFEEFRRGTVQSLSTYYASSPPRGEVVIILEGRRHEPADEMTLRERVRQLRDGGANARDITLALTRELGVPRNVAYRLAHDT
jgi:16S rRNA (cytidine1402-2'-O)-methyltransferase